MYGSWLKKPSICPWVASREKAIQRAVGETGVWEDVFHTFEYAILGEIEGGGVVPQQWRVLSLSFVTPDTFVTNKPPWR